MPCFFDLHLQFEQTMKFFEHVPISSQMDDDERYNRKLEAGLYTLQVLLA
jgi:hypothetical protein